MRVLVDPDPGIESQPNVSAHLEGESVSCIPQVRALCMLPMVRSTELTALRIVFVVETVHGLPATMHFSRSSRGFGQQ